MPSLLVKILFALNIAAFTYYLHRLGRTALWRGALGAFLLGPLVWPVWFLIRLGERRRANTSA